MVNNFFDDKTMTFGEHIEELRTHLVRALIGLGIAVVITTYYGNIVIKILTNPIQSQWEAYDEGKKARRLAEMRKEEELLAPEKRRMPVTVYVSPEETIRFLRSLGLENSQAAPTETMRLETTVSPTDLADVIYHAMARLNGKYNLKTMSAQEAVYIWFKASLGAAIVLASPWIFYQLYSFVAVGLYAHERRFVNLTIPFSVFLFLGGVSFCYFVMFPVMIRFLLGANEWMDLEAEIRLSEWVGFAVMLILIFGIMFQMPLLMVILEQVGIVSHRQLAEKRRIAIFVNFVIAAAVTPTTDPTNLALLAIPMCLLFEVGLLLMRRFERKPIAETTDLAGEILEPL